MTNKEKRNVLYQYNLFLDKMDLNEDEMHPVQKEQLKDAFYTGFGQCLLLLKDNVALIDDDLEAEKAMMKLLEQCVTYFNRE